MGALRVTEDELRELVVARLGLVDKAAFDRAVGMAARLRIPLEQALIERERIPPGFLLTQLAEAWGVPYVDLRVSDVSQEALAALREEYARAHALVPFARQGRQLRVAMADPRDRRVIDEIERTTGLVVAPCLCPEIAIRRAQLLYRGDLREILERSAREQVRRLTAAGGAGGEERSAVELLDRILEYAAVARASDIHIEPYQHEILVRYRIDGALQEVLSLAPVALASLVARVKILSGMRIDERRAPQDGRFEADLGGFRMDLRVSSLPTHWGEKLVLRVLAKDSIVLDLEDLGLAPRDFDTVVRNLLRPYGMILLTGPTGSGKTTTLYSMIVRLGTERQNVVNVSTVEDPVEYTIPRVNQVAINPAAGLDFATGLRALLRQDPDVIMVGEIRDRETAEIGVRSALVGRLLLSTLHTNDATGAVPRLLDMGIEPFLVASTLVLVIAQRLARRICTSCRETVEPDPAVLAALRAPEHAHTIRVLQREGALGGGEDPLAAVRLFRGTGCRQCHGTGFRGRIGVFEVFEVGERIRAMIMARQDAGAIRAAAIEQGMTTMFQDGLAKVFLGQTTLEEVYRVAV